MLRVVHNYAYDEYAMRVREKDGGFQCIALRGVVGEQVTCTIYDRRPEFCRDFVPGEERCLLARKARGLPHYKKILVEA